MSVLLVCDAPDCFKTTPGVVKIGRCSAPDGWWMQVGLNNRLVVSCCDAHFSIAAKLQALQDRSRP